MALGAEAQACRGPAGMPQNEKVHHAQELPAVLWPEKMDKWGANLYVPIITHSTLQKGERRVMCDSVTSLLIQICLSGENCLHSFCFNRWFIKQLDKWQNLVDAVHGVAARSNFRWTIWHSSQHLLYPLLCLTQLSFLLLPLITFYSFFNGDHFPLPANTPTVLSILFFSTSTRAFFPQITNISLLFSIAPSPLTSPLLYSHQCPSPFLEKQNKFY